MTMMVVGRLSQQMVDEAGPGRHSDGRGANGLSLRVRERGGRITKSWEQRIKIDGQVTTIGLGSALTVSLNEARALAGRSSYHVRQMRLDRQLSRLDHRLCGLETAQPPMLPGRQLELEAAPEEEPVVKVVPTIREAAEELVELRKPGWRKNTYNAWVSSLASYVYPAIGRMRVDEVESEHVLKAVRPWWNERHAAASHALSRISAILDYAIAAGHRKVNPVPSVRKTLRTRKKVVHQKSVPWRELPAFMALLRDENNIVALALDFIVLTAARSVECFAMRWQEVDLEEATWVVPEERIKLDREHRVPLSRQAVAVLNRAGDMMRRERLSKRLVFPSPRKLGVLTRTSTKQLLESVEAPGTTHGMRGSFKMWATENAYDELLSEFALGHVVGSEAQRAYRRTDLFDRRRGLMQDWADYLDGGE